MGTNPSHFAENCSAVGGEQTGPFPYGHTESSRTAPGDSSEASGAADVRKEGRPLAIPAAQQRGARQSPSADVRVAAVVARHERSLMRVALHWSLCRDDALDAYQRGLEIFFRRLDRVDPATEVAWLKVVSSS